MFIGYGLHLPKPTTTISREKTCEAKIVVVITGGPANISSALKAHARSAELWRALERAGAAGILNIANPKSMDIPWARHILLSRPEGMYLAEPALRETTGPIRRQRQSRRSRETVRAVGSQFRGAPRPR